jgi:translation initiation factor IF-2
MEKKKLKLSIAGSSKKTFNSIEQAKSKSKNTVVIEKKTSKFGIKSQYPRPNNNNFRTSKNNTTKTNNFSRSSAAPSSDFEKRKLAEQRATRRLKGETPQKDNKSNKIAGRRRELKLTISRALSEDSVEDKSRSLASLKRGKQR